MRSEKTRTISALCSHTVDASYQIVFAASHKDLGDGRIFLSLLQPEPVRSKYNPLLYTVDLSLAPHGTGDANWVKSGPSPPLHPREHTPRRRK